jgi:hypothetical protein
MTNRMALPIKPLHLTAPAPVYESARLIRKR